ncbi:hypothetical protein DFH08DRAFT_815475 [Mycena albidolilacea]|uniref:Secreted protein n=1 Tax=Mycena albidolilacea TaxID=1033008 RepID=A0AAD7EK66_9AGAR|nr:hypothetical protein DFH08DRAFT_815475 [Mycena albidolilacea]
MPGYNSVWIFLVSCFLRLLMQVLRRPYMVPHPAPYLSTEQLYNHPSPYAAPETTITASDDAVNTTRKRASSMSDETPAAAKRGRGRLRKDANAHVPAKPNLFYRTY